MTFVPKQCIMRMISKSVNVSLYLILHWGLPFKVRNEAVGTLETTFHHDNYLLNGKRTKKSLISSFISSQVMSRIELGGLNSSLRQN